MSQPPVIKSQPLAVKSKDVEKVLASSISPLKAYVDPIPLRAPTSTVVHPKADGTYDWADAMLLVPHEGLRVDMLRVDQVMGHMNFSARPWKAQRFADWIHTWKSMVADHHNNEEHIQNPFVAAEGFEVPDNMRSEHEELLRLLDQLVAAADRAVNEPTDANADKIRDIWRTFYSLFLAHLEDEERVWPKVYRSMGQEKTDAVVKKIVQNGVKNGGKPFQLEAAAIVQAMGAPIGGSTVDQGWGDAFQKAEMKKGLPPPVRMCCCLMPLWVQEYEVMKSRLASIAEDAEEPPPLPKASVCGGCIVC